MRAPAPLAAVLGALAAAAGTPAAGPRFSAHVDNPWFPLRPGTVYRYRGVKDGRPSREVMTVTHRIAAVGQAEDHFAVLALRTSVMVPWLRSSGALLTKEWTPLEPGILDHKYYVRGVGTVLEQTVKGGNERNELISFSR